MNPSSIEKLTLVVGALAADRERLLQDAHWAEDADRKAALRARAVAVSGQIGLVNEVLLDEAARVAAVIAEWPTHALDTIVNHASVYEQADFVSRARLELDRLRERATGKRRDGTEPGSGTPPSAADAPDFGTYLGRVRTFAAEAQASPNATAAALAELLLRVCRALDMGLNWMNRDIRAPAEPEMLIAAARPFTEDAFGNVKP